MSNDTPRQQPRSVFDDTREITRRFAVAVREALLDHKRAGNPVAIWRDGKVVIVPPEEIVVWQEEDVVLPGDR
jgi:hypothetical protein